MADASLGLLIFAAIIGAVLGAFRLSERLSKPKSTAKFCRRCGNRLAPNNYVASYDPNTGKPVQPYLHQMCCPDKFCGIFYDQ